VGSDDRTPRLSSLAFFIPSKIKKRANPQRASPTERLSTHQPFSGYSLPNIENGTARDLGTEPALAEAAAAVVEAFVSAFR
jgi:hypothetical protein